MSTPALKPSTQPDLSGHGAAYELPRIEGEWQAARNHQVVFAAAGVLHLHAGEATWLLPPQRAAWIPAGVHYRLHTGDPVSLRVIELAPELAELPADGVRVFEVSTLGREMLLHAVRWPADRDPDDEQANRFFMALASMCGEWLQEARPYCLPHAQSAELGQAMDYAIEHLHEEPCIEEAARKAGLSARTLARRFAHEAGTTWRKFLHDARMMKAMELLSDPGTSVTEAAHAVGFNSLGAFTRAFVDFTGERPRDYRRR